MMNRLTNRMKRIGAFTLIELLIVIAVITILAALLMPVLSSVERKSQQTGCLNNIRQLTMAGFMYANDSGSYASQRENGRHHLWMGIGYYGSKHILICPSTHAPSPVPLVNTLGAADLQWVWDVEGSRGQPGAETNVFLGSYALNGWLYDHAFSGGMQNPEYMMSKQTMIQRPSETPVFYDSGWLDAWPLETDPPNTDLYDGTSGNSTPGMQRVTIARHGGVNPATAPIDFDTSQRLPGAIDMGFADGHTDLVKLENLWGLYWHLNWQPPSPRPQ